MRIDPNTSIFVQLADRIRFEIFSKERGPGSKLESIREMAVLLEVNPNTVKRVYKVLEEEGLIYSKSTLGYFVSEDDALITVKRNSYIKEQFDGFLNILKSCNISEEEFFKGIRGIELDDNH